MSEIRKQALGRGLSALFEASQEDNEKEDQSFPFALLMENILPGRYQPRHHFPEEELEALASSIQEKGVLQPILVRDHPVEKGKYEIVAGERRWRAAKKAGYKSIPALIKDFSDGEVLEVGLLENIQRQDLNPIEEAEGYRRLAEEFNHTQESLARILGKSRSHIANTLRLLTLPKAIKDHINEGNLSAGHGRALIGAEDPEGLAQMIIEQNLNVRQAELLAKRTLSTENSLNSSQNADPEKEILRSQLTDLLGTPVDLNLKGRGGKIVIPFKNPTELDALLQKLNRIKDSL